MEENLVKNEMIPEPQRIFEEKTISAGIDLSKISEEENGVDDSGISDSKLMLYKKSLEFLLLALCHLFVFFLSISYPKTRLPNFFDSNFTVSPFSCLLQAFQTPTSPSQVFKTPPKKLKRKRIQQSPKSAGTTFHLTRPGMSTRRGQRRLTGLKSLSRLRPSTLFRDSGRFTNTWSCQASWGTTTITTSSEGKLNFSRFFLDFTVLWNTY